MTAHSQGRLPWLSFLKGPRARLKGSCNIDTQIRPRLREAWDDGPIPCSPRPRRQKVQDCGNLRILQIGHISSKCTVSIQHVRKTWGQLRPARPQLRPNLDPLGPSFGPAWLQDVAAGPQVGHIWEQLWTKLRSIWLQRGGRSRPNAKTSMPVFTGIFHFFCYR